MNRWHKYQVFFFSTIFILLGLSTGVETWFFYKQKLECTTGTVIQLEETQYKKRYTRIFRYKAKDGMEYTYKDPEIGAHDIGSEETIYYSPTDYNKACLHVDGYDAAFVNILIGLLILLGYFFLKK